MFLSLIAIVILLLIALGVWDFRQEKHTILRNFSVIEHVRYILEKVGPGMRQYWVTNDKEEQPFNICVDLEKSYVR